MFQGVMPVAEAQNTRDEIIRKGAALMHLKGYHATGIQEILDAAGVPKGSFYFYFRSKEDFGLEVIDYYTTMIEALFSRSLGDRTKRPLKRFDALLDVYASFMQKQHYTLGCPIGNLSLEMADTNERFRERLDASIETLIQAIASCLEEAKREGELPAGKDTGEAARFIFYGFEGVLLHMKVLKNKMPMNTFKSCIYTYLMHEQPAQPE